MFMNVSLSAATFWAAASAAIERYH